MFRSRQRGKTTTSETGGEGAEQREPTPEELLHQISEVVSERKTRSESFRGYRLNVPEEAEAYARHREAKWQWLACGDDVLNGSLNPLHLYSKLVDCVYLSVPTWEAAKETPVRIPLWLAHQLVELTGGLTRKLSRPGRTGRGSTYWTRYLTDEKHLRRAIVVVDHRKRGLTLERACSAAAEELASTRLKCSEETMMASYREALKLLKTDPHRALQALHFL